VRISDDKEIIEIDIADDPEWVERLSKTANEICDDPNYNHIKLNEKHTGFIVESNDSGALSCIGWSIERHLDAVPSRLKPIFQKILGEVKTRKENLERS
jgi:hypothetical protein